jgi:exodeoxyribonuclease-5
MLFELNLHDLSPQQEEGLSKINDWLEGRGPRQQVFKLFGYAGTGKTCLARLVAVSSRKPERVRFVAYTGKAAYVLRTKGCKDASTIHQLLYRRQWDEDRDDDAVAERILPLDDIAETKAAKFTRIDPEFEVNEAGVGQHSDLIIVDECSMVNEEIGQDLLSCGLPILVLGDPAQLPPVKGEGGFFIVEPADVMLTEIHRQEAGNPVLHLAGAARHREQVRVGHYGSSRVVWGDHLTVPMVLDADQVIVGTHRTRRIFNRRIRDHLGYTDWLPVKGDKLVCLKNNHDRELLNGSLWRVQSTWKGEGEETHRKVVRLTLRSDDDGRHRELEAVVPVELFGLSDTPHEEQYDSFTYGYALTAHKAQGSEWDNVLVIDESWIFGFFAGEEMRWRWLYTAITRAKKRVTIVRGWRKNYGG